MSTPVFDINTQLSDLVETTLKEGPQVVSKDGVETAVLVSIEDWKRLKPSTNGGLIDPLTDPNGPHDLDIPPRRSFILRPAKLS